MKTNSFAFLIITCIILSACGKKDFPDRKYWENLDYLIRGTVPFKNQDIADIDLKLWEDSVTVSIAGNYQKSDSLQLDSIIREFNVILPNLVIKWSLPNNEAKLRVFFTQLGLDIFSRRYHIDVSETSYYGSSNHRKKNLHFYNHSWNITEVKKATLLINKKMVWGDFAKTLVMYKELTGINLYNFSVMGGYASKLTGFDKFFFTTIYSEDFRMQYAKFLRSHYSLFEQFRYLTDAGTKLSIIAILSIFFIVLYLYLSIKVFWKKFFEEKPKNDFNYFVTSGSILVLSIIVSYVLVFPLVYNNLKVGELPVLGKFLSFSLVNYFVVSYALFIIEHRIYSRVTVFNKRQLVRIGSMLFLALVIYLIKEYKIKVSLQFTPFVYFFGYWGMVLLFIAIRLMYFHDRHLKEIIRQQQQIKIDKLEHLQTQAQLEAIHARTNPHFLYNSLNTIASLTRQDAAKAEDFSLKLSKLMRWRTNTEQPAEITLANEIEVVKLYLDIEKERFGDRFQFKILIPEAPEKIILPSDIVLHLVENAVKHGVSEKEGESWLEITVTERKGNLKIVVSDNGPDFPDDLIRGTGLKNILQKLDILYFDSYEFVIFKHPEKRVEITIKRR